MRFLTSASRSASQIERRTKKQQQSAEIFACHKPPCMSHERTTIFAVNFSTSHTSIHTRTHTHLHQQIVSNVQCQQISVVQCPNRSACCVFKLQRAHSGVYLAAVGATNASAHTRKHLSSSCSSARMPTRPQKRIVLQQLPLVRSFS